MQRAIIDGKKFTGITTMYMAEGLDTGDMLLKSEIRIEDNDNFEDIHDKLGLCGAELIVKTLDALEKDGIERIPQDEAQATYAAKITKEDCLIDFSLSARRVHDLIRGLSPIPLALTHTPDGKLLKIWKAETSSLSASGKNFGEVISLDDGIHVACGDGSVKLLGVLPEGKSKMSASDYIRGRKLNIGDILK
jgi:methionyl-tRNA formyltransferase